MEIKYILEFWSIKKMNAWKFVFTTWLIIKIKVIATFSQYSEKYVKVKIERELWDKQLFFSGQFLVYIFQLCFLFPPWNNVTFVSHNSDFSELWVYILQFWIVIYKHNYIFFIPWQKSANVA